MTLKIRIIAPDRTVWNADGEEVILPSSTGQLGILQGHIPLLTALDTGVMRIRIKKEWQPIILLGGFAEVKNDNITILVNGAEEVTDMDIDRIKSDLQQAISNLTEAKTDKDKIEATQNLRKARARMQAANVISQ